MRLSRKFVTIPLGVFLAFVVAVAIAADVGGRRSNTMTNGVELPLTILSDSVGTAFPSASQPAYTSTRLFAAASNNSTNLKASAGTVLGLQLTNTAAALSYFKLYNKATAPTCGSDTPVITFALAANSGQVIIPPHAFPMQYFSLGIGYCMVTGKTDADNTAVAAADQTGVIQWQ